MTKQELVEHVKIGWRKFGYVSGHYFDRASWGRPNNKTTCCCAIGAAVTSRGGTISDLLNTLDASGWDWVDILKLSDDAGSKEAAIEALEAWAR